MRLDISQTLRTRPGDNTKGARLSNSVVDIKNNTSVARKRPGLVSEIYNFTTPIQGFASLSDIISNVGSIPYNSYDGSYDDIFNLMFSVNNDNYQVFDVAREYDPTKSYPLGSVAFITSGNAIPGETVDGETWFAQADIDPANERYRPNYNPGNVLLPRGQMWSKVKPTSDRYQATVIGVTGVICASSLSASYAAWQGYPYNNPANNDGSWGSGQGVWRSLSYVSGSEVFINTYVRYNGQDIFMSTQSMGTVGKVA